MKDGITRAPAGEPISFDLDLLLAGQEPPQRRQQAAPARRPAPAYARPSAPVTKGPPGETAT